MQQEIIDRIQALGGDISKVKGISLQEDILSIEFSSVLYYNDGGEPIYGLFEYIDEIKDIYHSDKDLFYNKIFEKYYCLTDEGFGQFFWQPVLFTPFREGTVDFEEWNKDFTDGEFIDLSPIIEYTGDKTPDLLQIFYSYGFPDHYYICFSDPNPKNPTLFGTDHEVFFSEITNEGSLLDMLNSFLTKEELRDFIEKEIESGSIEL